MKIKITLKVLIATLFVCFFLFTVSSAENGHYIDSLGHDIYLPKPPQHIVSLAPNITEILFALGLGDKVVGVTNYCNYPPEALKKEKVGMLLNPSIEKILSLSPDLILLVAEGANKDTYEKLQKIKAKVFVISPSNIGKLYDSIVAIGKICRVEDRAAKVVSTLKKRMKKVKDSLSDVKPVPLLFLLDINPLVSVSSKSFYGELFSIARADNVVKNSRIRYPRIGWEEIIKFSPEVIIIAKHSDNMTENFMEFEKMPAVRATPAFKNGRIYLVDGDIVTRMGPRIIDAIEIFAKKIHPEVFK
ncbi:MAG: hypothetical protein D6734_12200 [Candidatus Schekmanbacteria bacterium]|nr:MAG: hypothetical protein D6734_12200 [Candidatus Schekmanbacteria bacterium]